MSRTYTFNKLLLQLHRHIDEAFEIHEARPHDADDIVLELANFLQGDIDGWRDWRQFQLRKMNKIIGIHTRREQ